MRTLERIAEAFERIAHAQERLADVQERFTDGEALRARLAEVYGLEGADNRVNNGADKRGQQ